MASLNEALQQLPGGSAAPGFDEDWRYTSLERAIDVTHRWIDAGTPVADSSALDERIAAITQSVDAQWIVVRNGVVDAAAMADKPSLQIQQLAAEKAPQDRALATLSAALESPLLRVDVHAATELPLAFLLIDNADKEAAVSNTNIRINVAPGCDVELIEYHASQGSADHYGNASLKVHLDEGATLRHVRIQDRKLGHMHTSHTAVKIESRARYLASGFDLGGGLIRNDLEIALLAADAHTDFTGLYLAGDQQHIDNHTRVEHAVGPATSSQEYRGILNGNCRCVWNGKAIVHEGADGTDASQANHNLLLSDKAEINTKPELEIYADDVKCAHGTTVGQLDEMALYYLQTRGIGKHEARQMLTYAFAVDLVSRIALPVCSDMVGELVAKRLQQLTQGEIT